jgi:hypothetical protein
MEREAGTWFVVGRRFESALFFKDSTFVWDYDLGELHLDQKQKKVTLHVF